MHQSLMKPGAMMITTLTVAVGPVHPEMTTSTSRVMGGMPPHRTLSIAAWAPRPVRHIRRRRCENQLLLVLVRWSAEGVGPASSATPWRRVSGLGLQLLFYYAWSIGQGSCGTLLELHTYTFIHLLFCGPLKNYWYWSFCLYISNSETSVMVITNPKGSLCLY